MSNNIFEQQFLNAFRELKDSINGLRIAIQSISDTLHKDYVKNNWPVDKDKK